MYERNATPRDTLTGWERPAFACGCGRGCTSWPEHHANVARVDTDADAVVATLLADDLAPCKRHDFSDGDVCSKCDALRPMRRPVSR